jgi:hypothetical protein
MCAQNMVGDSYQGDPIEPSLVVKQFVGSSLAFSASGVAASSWWS